MYIILCQLLVPPCSYPTYNTPPSSIAQPGARSEDPNLESFTDSGMAAWLPEHSSRQIGFTDSFIHRRPPHSLPNFHTSNNGPNASESLTVLQRISKPVAPKRNGIFQQLDQLP